MDRATFPPGGGRTAAAVRAEDLRERSGVRHTELDARRVLDLLEHRSADPASRWGTTTPGVDVWSLDPYRGCSFGCRFCWARDAPEYARLADPAEFGHRVFVKRRAAQALEAEGTERKLRAHPIVLGVATDPYQPAEARHHLTRELLGVLARHRGLELALCTRSPLVVRDVGLLQRLGKRSWLSVHVAVPTLDGALARRLEPGAPAPERRLLAVRRLAEAGVCVGVDAIPILPELNDTTDALRALCEAAVAHGARWLRVAPLRLSRAGRRRFLRWLRTRLPEQVPGYRRRFAGGSDVDAAWLESLRLRSALLRAEVGLPDGPRRRRGSQLALPGIGRPRAA